MAFINGMLLIDAPASALNNAGQVPGARTDNTVAVKSIRTREGAFPYVSAQSFRYWLRTTLEQAADTGWQAAPVFREEKVAYADGNPIRYWDDDLFGYMRAPSKRTSAREKREADASRADETPTADAITRAAPFRVGTLVSIAPVNITEDFGTMSRHDGDPVPHEHQFYRTTLKGLFSLDLRACGTFWYRRKTGFRNLDDVRKQEAVEKGLEHLESEQAYRLPLAQRLTRVQALFEGLSRLEGGAKQTLHYTAVAPALVMAAVTRGGNHLFDYAIQPNQFRLPQVNREALDEALTIWADQLLSPVYIGWVRGYLDDERAKVEEFARERPNIRIGHPRSILAGVRDDLAANPEWLA